MQRIHFSVVQHSLEWRTVMQIGRGASIMERDMVWTQVGFRQASLCHSHLVVKASPTFLLLCSFTVFREIRRELERSEPFNCTRNTSYCSSLPVTVFFEEEQTLPEQLLYSPCSYNGGEREHSNTQYSNSNNTEEIYSVD